jgi:hypothetical protein
MMIVPDDVEAKIFDLLKIREEPGWTGAFSRKQYPGALPNGTRVRKVIGEAGDTHSLGAQATVLGSVVRWPWEELGYFVEWDDEPRCAVFVVGAKIAKIA